MNTSLRDIEIFLAFLEEGGVAGAARACETTQPTVSKSLQRIELEFGARLFERGDRKLRLAPGAQAIADQLRPMLEAYRKAMAAGQSLARQERGVLRIGTTGGIGTSLIATQLATLLNRRPALRLQFHVATSDSLLEALTRRDLELAVLPIYGTFSSPGLRARVLGEDALVATASRHHPLSLQQRVELGDVAAYPWALSATGSTVRREFEAPFLACGAPVPLVAVESDHPSELVRVLMHQTRLLAMLLEAVADRDLVPLNIQSLRVNRKLALITRGDLEHDPLVADAVQFFDGAGPRAGRTAAFSRL